MKAEANRDLLFASGAGLVFCGLFPYLHARYVLLGFDDVSGHNDSDSDSSVSGFEIDPLVHTHVVHPATNTTFDPVTCSMGVAFALLGVGVLCLSSPDLPRHLIRVSIKAVGVPVFVVAMGAMMLVQSFYAGTDVAAAWQASALRSFDGQGDGPLEIKFNHQFCSAFGDRVCQDGRVEDAKVLFSNLREWPSGADSQASISEICDRSSDGEGKQVCQLCSSIRHSPLIQRPSTLLSVVVSTSQDAIHWCGDYLTTQNPNTSLQSSPFRQHREEILRNWDESPVSLTRSVRLLVVLIWFSLTSIVGMMELHFQPEWLLKGPRQTTDAAPDMMDDSEWDMIAVV